MVTIRESGTIGTKMGDRMENLEEEVAEIKKRKEIKLLELRPQLWKEFAEFRKIFGMSEIKGRNREEIKKDRKTEKNREGIEQEPVRDELLLGRSTLYFSDTRHLILPIVNSSGIVIF